MAKFDVKPWLTSRTVWFNIIGLMVVIAQYLSANHLVDDQTIAMILAVGNFILRFRTDQPLDPKKMI